MIRTTCIAAVVLALGATSMTSCTKYEEGPGISLRSRTERVANTWEVERAENDGQDVTASFDQYALQLFSDGDAALVALYTLGDLTIEYETDGTWSFANDQEYLDLDFENDGADQRYQILKLKENELWLREAGGDLELQLKPQ